jgi:putative addiction module killer protein
MIEVRRSAVFAEWLRRLRNPQARIAIFRRIDRLAAGNPGDIKSIGGGLNELRIDLGPGYRLYFVQHGQKIVVLLCGGDKSTQENDIIKAREMMRALDNAN